MKSLSQSLNIFIERIFAKRYSPAFAQIFTNWQMIVGTQLAEICVPIMIDRFDKVLIVQVYDNSKAIELYFMQEVIIQRINAILERAKLSLRINKLLIRNQPNHQL